MIKQKPISLKIDAQVLSDLDALLLSYPECRVNRNKFINYSVRFILECAKLQIYASSKLPPLLLRKISGDVYWLNSYNG